MTSFRKIVCTFLFTLHVAPATMAQDNFFHVDCWLQPCHKHTGHFKTQHIKDACAQAVVSKAVTDSIDTYVDTLLSCFRYQLKLLYSLNPTITDECLDGIIKQLPAMKHNNPHRIIMDVSRSVIIWHPFFIPTILSIKDVKTRRQHLP